MALLEVSHLAVSYGAIEAVRDASLSIEAGEIVAVIGANGAGKSTLLSCLSGLVRPAAGAALYAGRSLAGMRPRDIVAAGLAARLDFTLDEIEDLRIAVDEACAMLLAQAVPGADLDCTFTLNGDSIRVGVSVLTLDGQQPSRDTFAWTVLSALAGEVDSTAGVDDRVTITLLKRRSGTAR